MNQFDSNLVGAPRHVQTTPYNRVLGVGGGKQDNVHHFTVDIATEDLFHQHCGSSPRNVPIKCTTVHFAGFFLMLGVLFLTGSLMVVFMMLVGVAAGVAFGFAMLFGTRQVWGACSTNVCTWMAELKA